MLRADGSWWAHDRARHRRHPRRGSRHRGRPRRGGRDGLLHRPQHAFAAVGDRPPRDDRRDRRAGERGGRHGHRGGGRPSRPGGGARAPGADRASAAGGTGIAVAVDHLDPEAVRALVARIEREQGRLDVLVNDIWGGEHLFEWDTPIWEHDLANGLRLVRGALDTHLITSHFALPLLLRRDGGLVVEVTDGTADYNATRYRVNAFYDLAKNALIRFAWAQAQDVGDRATVVA